MERRRTRTTMAAVYSAVLAAVLLIVGAASCALPEGAQTPTNGTPATEQSAPASAAENAAPDPGPTIIIPGPADPDDPGPDNPLALPLWLPIGPASPNDPSPHGWYERNRARQCPAADQSFSAVALGLTAVCEAVFQGDPAGWAQASRFPAQAPRRQPDCLEQTAYQVLAGILAFHDRHADVRLEGIANAAGTACPSQLDGLAQEGGVEVEDRAFSTGEVVRIMGRFNEVRRIALAGTQIPFQKQAENTYVFVVPDPAGLRSARVQVWDAAGPVPGNVTLDFADAGAGDSPASTEGSSAAPDPSVDAATGAPDPGPEPSPAEASEGIVEPTP